MTALYIHIPFCERKCNYCDFVSYAGKEALIDDYVKALINEIQDSPHFNVGSQILKPHTKVWGIKTIFFGGGTPTLLEPRHFELIVENVAATFRSPSGGGLKTAATAEITVEANPGTADLTKLKALRSLGINRLSIGVQSFNDKHLKTLGRIHTAEQAKQFYRDARDAGFENISLDLMFALPGQTLDEWKRDLDTTLNPTTQPPNHLSTYNLQIEENTPLSLHPTLYPLPPDEDEELAMYEYTIETLTANGYRHYEISNFAKPGFACRHNLVYWRNENYLGIGAGAHSHWNGQRWSNPNCIEQYLETATLAPREIEGFSRRLPVAARPDQRETLFLGLRLLEGLPVEKFNGFEKEVSELVNDGLLERANDRYRLTRQGLYLGNLVFARFV